MPLSDPLVELPVDLFDRQPDDARPFRAEAGVVSGAGPAGDTALGEAEPAEQEHQVGGRRLAGELPFVARDAGRGEELESAGGGDEGVGREEPWPEDEPGR